MDERISELELDHLGSGYPPNHCGGNLQMNDPVFEVFNDAVKHKGTLTSHKATDIILAQILLTLKETNQRLGELHVELSHTARNTDRSSNQGNHEER